MPIEEIFFEASAAKMQRVSQCDGPPRPHLILDGTTVFLRSLNRSIVLVLPVRPNALRQVPQGEGASVAPLPLDEAGALHHDLLHLLVDHSPDLVHDVLHGDLN